MLFRILILLSILGCNLTAYSQSFMWKLLPNSPGTTGMSRFEDVYFVNANTGWIISYGGEVYKTTNAGVNWTLNLQIQSSFFRSLGFFDANTGIIGTLKSDTTKKLYRTTNGGINWYSVTLPSPRITGICGISIVDANYAFACGRYQTPANAIKTTDKGETWINIHPDNSLVTSLVDCYFWTSDSGIAVGGLSASGFEFGKAAIIKTTNAGVTWQRVHLTDRTEEWCWKISFVNRSTGFVSVERNSGFSYILKTTNNGDNWTEIPFRTYDQEGIGFLNENTGWVGGWTGPTYQTTNGGANWQLAGWGTNVNRIRFLNDTLGHAVGDRVYKYSRAPVGINSTSAEIPDSYNLFQNYPNPFNPVTKIKFNIPQDQRGKARNLPGGNVSVKLIVYDALGRVAATLVNEMLLAGTYETEWNAAEYSSGIYFYTLSTGEYSQTNGMILLK